VNIASRGVSQSAGLSLLLRRLEQPSEQLILTGTAHRRGPPVSLARQVSGPDNPAELSILAGECFTFGSGEAKLALDRIDLLGQQEDLASLGTYRVGGCDMPGVLGQG
jgi:hypothetical protein